MGNTSGFVLRRVSVAVTSACAESAVVCHPALLEVSLGSRNVSEAPGGDITPAGAGTMTHTLGLGR